MGRLVRERGALRAVAHPSVAAMPPEEWDRLAGGDFYSSHGWVSYQERDPRSEAWVVAVHDGPDLVAAAPLFLVHDEKSPAYDMFATLGCGGERPVTMLVGNRRGYDNRLLVQAGREDGLALLVEALVAEGNRVGATFAWWPYLDDESITRLLPHVPVDEPWLLQVTAGFHLPPGGFDGFLSGLSKDQRGKVRKDRRQFESSDRSTHREDVGRHLGEVAQLVTNVEAHHGADPSVTAIESLLADQVADLGHRAHLMTCRRSRDLVACALFYEGGDELAVRVAGLDYGEVGDHAEYFETVYYQAIELAYELEVSRVSLGFGALQAKRHRGAELQPRWAVPLLPVDQFALTAPRDHAEEVLATIESRERVRRGACRSPLLDTLLGTELHQVT